MMPTCSDGGSLLRNLVISATYSAQNRNGLLCVSSMPQNLPSCKASLNFVSPSLAVVEEAGRGDCEGVLRVVMDSVACELFNVVVDHSDGLPSHCSVIVKKKNQCQKQFC